MTSAHSASPTTSSSAAARPLGIGIVGTGWVAGAHIQNFQKIQGCRIVAVSSRERARAAAKIRAHGLEADAEPYGDLEQMLRHDGLDVVVICTPHRNHPDETIAAAQAGKHVVIEKPVALDRDGLRRAMQAVAKAEVQTSVCFEVRWIGLLRNVKAMLRQGLIGTPFYGEASYFHGCGPWYPQYPWNRRRDMGGDALLTAGCHALDGLIWLMGAEVVEVQAMSNTSEQNPLDYEYDPNVVALLRFASGAIGKVAASIECRQPYLFPVLLQGERGTIWNDKVSTLQWPGLPKEQWATVPAALPDSGDVADHPYLGQLEHFVACIRDGRRPHNDLASCAHVHDVMFAIQDALRERRAVEVQRTPGASTLFD